MPGLPIAFFDAEADGFLYEATTVWCLVSKDLGGVYHIYLNSTDSYKLPVNVIYYRDITTYLHWLSEHCVVGHNIINYDLPLLKKLHNFDYTIDPKRITDTHILSRLYSPDREAHSIAHFGEKFNSPKGDHSDFSCLSQDMIDYCIRDVDILEKTYNYLLIEGAEWDWSEAIKLEYNIWHIQMKQETKGVLFNKKAAEILLRKITEETDDIEKVLVSEIPHYPKDQGTLKKIFLKSGEYTTPVQLWLGTGNE